MNQQGKSISEQFTLAELEKERKETKKILKNIANV